MKYFKWIGENIPLVFAAGLAFISFLNGQYDWVRFYLIVALMFFVIQLLNDAIRVLLDIKNHVRLILFNQLMEKAKK